MLCSTFTRIGSKLKFEPILLPNGRDMDGQRSFGRQVGARSCCERSGCSSGDDVRRMAYEARSLASFLADGEGAGLLAGWRRVSSMLSAEEKKAKKSFLATTDPALFNDIEKSLHLALAAVPDGDVDFASKLMALGQLRLPIDAFFDGIVVNDDDPAIRLNRFGLLALIREKMLMVADFSKIEGLN